MNLNQSKQLWKNLFTQNVNRFTELNQRVSEILQHTPQGLVKIDQDGKITEEYSTQCTIFFERTYLAGLLFHEVIFANDLNNKEGWINVFPILFNNTMMTFEALTGLLPNETTYIKNEKR